MKDAKAKYYPHGILLNRRRIGLFGIKVCLLLLFGQSAHSQTYPVQANLFITPPYSVYLSDYTTPGSTRFNVTAYLADLSRPDLDVRFRLLIEGVGVEIKTKEGFIGSRFNLASGIPRQIYGDELVEYF